MRELAEDNLAFEEGTGTKPGPLGIESKGFEERRASELTESVLRYSRRDQHLVLVSILFFHLLQGATFFVVVEQSLFQLGPF